LPDPGPGPFGLGQGPRPWDDGWGRALQQPGNGQAAFQAETELQVANCRATLNTTVNVGMCSRNYGAACSGNMTAGAGQKRPRFPSRCAATPTDARSRASVDEAAGGCQAARPIWRSACRKPDGYPAATAARGARPRPWRSTGRRCPPDGRNRWARSDRKSCAGGSSSSEIKRACKTGAQHLGAVT